MSNTDRKTREAIRYLGFGRNAADGRTYELVKESFEDLDREASPKSISRIFDLDHREDGKLVVGSMEIESRSLNRNLKGCGQVVLFGATLGAGTDRLIRRVSLTDMAKAVVLQACAAAELEEYCDQCQMEIAAELEKKGLYLRPRFSPGYGDFDIHFQEPLMRMLDCAKTIGLTMTDSYMMSPTKSVTAVIGISTTKERCPISGCETCSKKDCAYRR